jgi:hypothetical protein
MKISPLTLLTLSACTFALSACAGRTHRIEHRQDVRTSGVEVRQDRYDARYHGRQDRRDIRSDRADARYERW